MKRRDFLEKVSELAKGAGAITLSKVKIAAMGAALATRCSKENPVSIENSGSKIGDVTCIDGHICPNWIWYQCTPDFTCDSDHTCGTIGWFTCAVKYTITGAIGGTSP